MKKTKERIERNIQKWNTTKITDKNYEKTAIDHGSGFVVEWECLFC